MIVMALLAVRDLYCVLDPSLGGDEIRQRFKIQAGGFSSTTLFLFLASRQ
jgi:hypothetical protein